MGDGTGNEAGVEVDIDAGLRGMQGLCFTITISIYIYICVCAYLFRAILFLLVSQWLNSKKKTASFNPRTRIQGAKRACLQKKDTHTRPAR